MESYSCFGDTFDQKSSNAKAKFVLMDKMEREYNIVRKGMLEEIQLTPFDPNKSLRLVIDGASTKGVSFMLFQWADEMNPGNGPVIVNANCSRFEESQLRISLV